MALSPDGLSARLDALLAIGIASLEQMQRIQDDTWLGASTDSDDEIDDSVLANLQLPTSTDSTLGGVDPPEDFLSPGAMWGLIASPCTAPESPFMPSSGTPSRASPHIPPAANRRFCFPVWTTTSTQSSQQRVPSAAHVRPARSVVGQVGQATVGSLAGCPGGGGRKSSGAEVPVALCSPACTCDVSIGKWSRDFPAILGQIGVRWAGGYDDA